MQDGKQEDRRVRRTKKLLKQAFIDLLHEKEYKTISVTDIVDKADYNRSTFYAHYDYKEELVEELNESLLNGLITAFFNFDEEELNQLTPGDIVIFDYILKKREFFILWKTSEAIPRLQEVFIDKFSKAFKEELLKKTGINKDIDLNLFVIFNTYGILGLILDWIKRDFTEPPQVMAQQLIYLINKEPFSNK
ncbi:TetR/AcrR family transcriptional regulator [Neobacillus niacini]|uniref:TetR/AcrR family transcriptional regulator n=1 Tax=Neobacillus niacini TaxID=86668 RepID=UPI002FFDB771